MSLGNSPTLRVIQLATLLLSAVAYLWWFFGTPNFHNALEYGVGAVLRRGPSEVLVFLGVPLAGLLHLFLAYGVWSRRGGQVLWLAAWLVCGVDLLAALGAVLLMVALRNFNMH